MISVPWPSSWLISTKRPGFRKLGRHTGYTAAH